MEVRSFQHLLKWFELVHEWALHKLMKYFYFQVVISLNQALFGLS